MVKGHSPDVKGNPHLERSSRERAKAWTECLFEGMLNPFQSQINSFPDELFYHLGPSDLSMSMTQISNRLCPKNCCSVLLFTSRYRESLECIVLDL